MIDDPAERPTPRETGSTDRGLMLASMARELAVRLIAAADRAEFSAGMSQRRLARRSRALAERFDAWVRGEATIEQRVDDLATWTDVRAEAREAGVR